MKKSTLLTMASVGAVASTSAMTFAAWDNLSDTTTSNEVTFNKLMWKRQLILFLPSQLLVI